MARLCTKPNISTLKMTSTPSSDKSLYFDAPLAHFNTMSSQSPPLPVNDAVVESGAPTTTEPGRTSPATEQPTVNGAGDVAVEGSEKPALTRNESSGWLPATDTPPSPKESNEKPATAARLNGNGHTRSTSLSPRRSGSLSRRSLFTNTDGQTIEGSTFIGGAATTGPNSRAEQNESLHQRAMSADASLTPKQRSKIAKAEGKSAPSTVMSLL